MLAAAGAACTPVVTVDRARPSGNGRSATPVPVTPPPQTPGSPAPSEIDTAFEPVAGDAYPNAKRLAGRFVEALTTYPRTAAPRRVLARAARKPDSDFDLSDVLRRTSKLVVPNTVSRGQVVYPQLGGLEVGGSVDRICVMVVVTQDMIRSHRRRGDIASTVTRTIDVRLVNRDDEWRVADVFDIGGATVADREDRVSAEARRVLDDARIELPDSARWDILRGDIDDRLLATMADLAEVAPYSVAVLKSGHPHNVFGTDRISGHTLGRGVDIWKVAGQPVVVQSKDKASPAYAFTTAALQDLKVPELGSPWDLDGPPQPGESRPSFTDAVHADHIHIAYKAP